MKIVLASGSPRRKEIMKNAGYDFEVKTSSADETLPDNITPDEAVKYLAEIKGDAVEVDESTLVVSADTVVALDGKFWESQRTKMMLFQCYPCFRAGHTMCLRAFA